MEPQQPTSNAAPVPRRRVRFADSSDEEERPVRRQRGDTSTHPQRRRTEKQSQLAALRERESISRAKARTRRTDQQRAADLARNAAAERERHARRTEEQQSTARQ